jgi:phage terminase large subunit
MSSNEINADVIINPAYLPFLNKSQFLQIFFGGSSSGKSYFLSDKIVLDVLDGCNYLCCRNVGSTIKRSVFNEVNKSISNMGLREHFSVNKSDMIITCKLNNRQILFCGLDDPEKVKSITPIEGVLERIFIEEATEIRREAYLQLKKRLRGRSEHSKHIIMAFNPILKSHWIYKEFFGGWQDDKTIYEDEKTLIVKTTYKDNIFLTEDDRKLLEDETDPYFYNVYTLGNWGVLGNVIFKNWRVEDLSDRIPQFDNLYLGLDVGYTNPNAFIKVHFDKENKKIYIIDEYYRAGMQDEDLYYTATEFCGNQYLMVDNAANKTIQYLASKGVLAVATNKGGDSVNRGIRFLWGFEIIIDVRCQNFKNEIEQYHWQEDKNGVVLEKPVKQNDHLMDALRYALENEMLEYEATAGKRI